MRKFMVEYEAERSKEAQEAEQRLRKELQENVEDRVKSVIDEHLSSWKKEQEAGQKSQQRKAHNAAVAAAVKEAKEAVGLKDAAKRIAGLESELIMLRKKERLVMDCATKWAALSKGKEVGEEPGAQKEAQAEEAGEMGVVEKRGLSTGPVEEAPGSAGPEREASDGDMGEDEIMERLETEVEAEEVQARVDEPSSTAKRKKSSQPGPPGGAGTALASLGWALTAAMAWRRLAVVVGTSSV
jgi:hypothetical protein